MSSVPVQVFVCVWCTVTAGCLWFLSSRFGAAWLLVTWSVSRVGEEQDGSRGWWGWRTCCWCEEPPPHWGRRDAVGWWPGGPEEDNFGWRSTARAGGRRATTPETAESTGEGQEEAPEHPRECLRYSYLSKTSQLIYYLYINKIKAELEREGSIMTHDVWWYFRSC